MSEKHFEIAGAPLRGINWGFQSEPESDLVFGDFIGVRHDEDTGAFCAMIGIDEATIECDVASPEDAMAWITEFQTGGWRELLLGATG